MIRVRVVGLVLAGLALARPAVGQGVFMPAGCDLKPGHFKVNSAELYLKSAYEKNSRERDLKDAYKQLTEAITMNGQDKNPAAWYYLGRYYVAAVVLLQPAKPGDLASSDSAFAKADTAFTKAEALAPKCAADIKVWRRELWRTEYNNGLAHMNAGRNDSAIIYYHRANLIYRDEPQAVNALAIVYFNGAQQLDSTAKVQQLDSAAKYFQATFDAAKDTQYASIRKAAMYNMAAAYQGAGRPEEAIATYQKYLATDPNDVQALGGVATLYMAKGQKDSAQAMYKRLIAHADSADPLALFQAGVDIYGGAPPFPDTAAIGGACRQRQKAAKPSHPGMTPAQRQSEMAKICNRETADSADSHAKSANGIYQVAGAAFQAVLKKQPELPNALLNLSYVYLALNDADSMLIYSRRLLAVDPMNRTAFRLHQQAWQLKARAVKDSSPAAYKADLDSSYHYVLAGDSLLPAEVTVTRLQLKEQGASATGMVSNFHEKASDSLNIVFEFISNQGAVVGSQKVGVPKLAAGTNKPFTVEVIGKNVASYRYRKE